MKPLVTIVTPVYNAMPYLEDYLSCLIRQTYRPLQVILVDDGSSDGSAECLQRRKAELEDAGLSVEILLCPHRSQAAAFNAALPLMEGSFFTWCDADDLLTPDSIEKKVTWLQAHPDIGMVRSNGLVLDADRNLPIAESARAEDRRQQDIFYALFTDRTYCYAGCYMVRTELFFSCYPQKQIPESPEGQNLQLLLPPASRSHCGYLDEILHTYCRRSSGHSSQTRSYRQSLQRAVNFTALRLAVLDHCLVDREYYTALARELEETRRGQLIRSAVLKARKELENENRNSDIS